MRKMSKFVSSTQTVTRCLTPPPSPPHHPLPWKTWEFGTFKFWNKSWKTCSFPFPKIWYFGTLSVLDSATKVEKPTPYPWIYENLGFCKFWIQQQKSENRPHSFSKKYGTLEFYQFWNRVQKLENPLLGSGNGGIGILAVFGLRNKSWNPPPRNLWYTVTYCEDGSGKVVKMFTL